MVCSSQSKAPLHTKLNYLYLVTLTIIHDMGNFSNKENKDIVIIRYRKDIVTMENNFEVGVNIDTTSFKSSILLRDRVETLRKPSEVGAGIGE